MDLFRCESKKLLIHQKGLLILLAFMIAAVVFWVITDSPAAPDMELYRASYEKELAQVEGALTQEKRNWIENAFSESFRAKQQLPQLYQAYYAECIYFDVQPDDGQAKQLFEKYLKEIKA